MVKKAMNKPYLTPNQVAELLMVSPTAVRQWAEKGELSALTTPGGHRRFLPREVERFARKRGVTLNVGENGALRVLIVDDNAPLTRYLKALLAGFPEQVVVDAASDGFVAGLKIREFAPDVVLLDLMMPGLNGFEVCRLLKSDPKTTSVRVIAMTGHPSPGNVEQIRNAGAEVCLSKPLDESVLLNLLGLEEAQSA